MRTIQFVESIDGLYDEIAEARLMDINKRKFCIRHKWINASLRWEKQLDEGFTSINFESEKGMFNREWGKGYGGIRFCSKCKRIDCIHRFKKEDTIEYRIGNMEDYDAFYVEKCEICGRKILTGSCQVLSKTPNLQERFYKPGAIEITGILNAHL